MISSATTTTMTRKRTASPRAWIAGRLITTSLAGTEKRDEDCVYCRPVRTAQTVAGGGTAANPFPLGEYFFFDKSGDWIRRAPQSSSSSTPMASRDRENAADAKPRKKTKTSASPRRRRRRRGGAATATARGAPPARRRARRRRRGCSRSAAQLALDRDKPEIENVLFDGAEEPESFLRAQRAAVQKTRDEIAEMKRFSDLRRAVKMSHGDARRN